MTNSADPDQLASLIWIYAVCKGMAYPGSAGPGLRFFFVCVSVIDTVLFCLIVFLHLFLRVVGVAKVSCILRHQCVQLILAYSWESPAILVAGKVLFCLFLHFHSCSSVFLVPLFPLLYYLVCLFSPFL